MNLQIEGYELKMKNKIKMEKMKKGYMKIPAKVFKMGLSSYATLVYMSLFTVPEEFNPSITFIQRRTGISRNIVIRSMKELENNRIINKIETGSIKRVSKYEFNDPKDWKRHEDKVTKTKTKKAPSHKAEPSNEGQKQIH